MDQQNQHPVAMNVVNNRRLTGLVTIDVEPDNVWADNHSKRFENIKCLPQFHQICQSYGVKPTYLVSWAIASDAECARILEHLLRAGDCEIGIHPHLWETPPLVQQDASNRAWVGPEYPEDALAAKIINLAQLIKQRFGAPLSHRAGRWGLDHRQVRILSSIGIRVDSSVIPGIDWTSTGILDHTDAPLEPYFIGKNGIFDRGSSGLLEVPCTIKPGVRLFGAQRNRYVGSIIKRVGLDSQWLRASPMQSPLHLVGICVWAAGQFRHMNLMSHSSEFMANGSPYWKSAADIDKQFSMYRSLFRWWQGRHVETKTLAEFAAAYTVAAEVCCP